MEFFFLYGRSRGKFTLVAKQKHQFKRTSQALLFLSFSFLLTVLIKTTRIFIFLSHQTLK